MKCRNCGHENDSDAKFCEKCGLNLKKSNMPESTKILIVVVIVLVSVLGLVSAMMIMNNHKTSSNINISTNNTTNSNISTNNNTGAPKNDANSGNTNNDGNNNQSTKQTQQITASQAEDLAAQDTAQTPIDVDYVPAYNYYHVDLQIPGQRYTDYVFIDATTGNIVNWVNGEPVQQ